MADKKLITYDCTLSFSFSTNDDDFMNPDFKYDHVNIVLDVDNGGSIMLVGNSESKHPFICFDLKNVFFNCCPFEFVDITSEDLLKSILFHKGLDSFGSCVFCYQPLKGSQFFLGVKEKVFENGLQKENEKKLVSEKFPERSRRKKS